MTKEKLQEHLAAAKAEHEQLVARVNVIRGYIQGLEYSLQDEPVAPSEPAP